MRTKEDMADYLNGERCSVELALANLLKVWDELRKTSGEAMFPYESATSLLAAANGTLKQAIGILRGIREPIDNTLSQD